MDRLRVAIVGAGRRAHSVYAPLVVMLKADVELVAVYSRRLESGTALASKYGVPAFDDLNQLVETARPDLCIVTVRNAANGPTGRQVAELGLAQPVLAALHGRRDDCGGVLPDESGARGADRRAARVWPAPRPH